jgi:hypothetical protein
MTARGNSVSLFWPKFNLINPDNSAAGSYLEEPHHRGVEIGRAATGGHWPGGKGWSLPWSDYTSGTNGGDISDDEYRRELEGLERRLKLVATPVQSHQLPNLEKAAALLRDLPALWLHPRVTDGQRETLDWQVFRRITIDGKDIVSIEPKAEYVPLFAVIASGQKYGYREFDPSPSPDTLLLSPSGISVSGIESWARKLAEVA